MVSEISFLRTKYLSLSFSDSSHPNPPVLTNFENPSFLWWRHSSLLAYISKQYWYQPYLLTLTMVRRGSSSLISHCTLTPVSRLELLQGDSGGLSQMTLLTEVHLGLQGIPRPNRSQGEESSIPCSSLSLYSHSSSWHKSSYLVAACLQLARYECQLNLPRALHFLCELHYNCFCFSD